MPVDGGLKCFGHPIAASGLRMAYEIYSQLQGRAGARTAAQPEHRPHTQPWRRSISGVAAVAILDYAGEPSRLVRQSELGGLIDSDSTVYIAGASGAPTAFVSEMLRDKPLTRDARILTTYVPGINPIDLSLLHPSAQVTGLFMQPGFSAAQREGRFRALPMSYSGFVRHLRENVEIDLAVVQVAAPDARGQVR